MQPFGAASKADLQDVEAGSSCCEKAVIRKLNWHILPKFFLMTILCYIDRTNLAFAALQLNKSLDFSERIYGIGSSVFFIGYSALQIPSNLILVRLGAPLWLSIIIVSWGIVATSFASLRNTAQFYLLRLLLGVTESGTFPGMWFHMSLFYTERELGVAYSWIMAGTALSQVFGAPLAAALLSLDGLMGMRGWQWLFIIEGLPTILLGLWISRSLVQSPLKASFLRAEEAKWLHQRQLRSKSGKAVAFGADNGAWAAIADWRTWYLALIAMLEALVKNSIIYWSPLIIASMVGLAHKRPMSHGHVGRALLGEAAISNSTSLSVAVKSIASAPLASKVAALNEHAATDFSGATVALLTALPFGTAALIMLFMAKHSAETGERRFHATLPFVFAAGALGCMAWLIDTDPVSAFGAMLGATILWGPAGILSAMPATFLSGPAAATGIALINSIANVGGMIGPFMIGVMRQYTNSYQRPISVLAGVTALISILVFFLPMERYSPESKGSSNRRNTAGCEQPRPPEKAGALQK